MKGVDLKPIFEAFVERIRSASTYYGNRIPESVMSLIEIEIRDDGGGVLAPFWLPVMQTGRPPRKNTKSHNLWMKIFAWMASRNMFRSVTQKGKENEAKSLTWYINKYGTKHFRSKVFIDVYKTAREECIDEIDKEYSLAISKITKEII